MCMLVRDRYRQAMVWESGSIAYHAKSMTEFLPPLCGALFMFADIRATFVMIPCRTTLAAFALCELDTAANLSRAMTALQLLETVHTSTNHTAQPRSLLRLFDGENLISCPAKHLTLSFLACDILSRCYAENNDVVYVEESQAYNLPAPSSCLAPMTSLSPALSCGKGNQRVPYTLVCDHRADCGDGSDEDFCVFPPCDMTAPLQCGSSKEVCRERSWMNLGKRWFGFVLLALVNFVTLSVSRPTYFYPPPSPPSLSLSHPLLSRSNCKMCQLFRLDCLVLRDK